MFGTLSKADLCRRIDQPTRRRATTAITLDRAEALAATTSGFDRLFWECVALIVRFAQATGLTYEAANILLFVVIHPLVTVALLVWLVAALRQNRRLRRLAVTQSAKRCRARRALGGRAHDDQPAATEAARPLRTLKSAPPRRPIR